jgi:hypothetical protein
LKLTGFLLDITRELPMHPPVRAWNSNLATLDQSHNGLSDVTRATRDIPVCGATSDKLYDWITYGIQVCKSSSFSYSIYSIAVYYSNNGDFDDPIFDQRSFSKIGRHHCRSAAQARDHHPAEQAAVGAAQY